MEAQSDPFCLGGRTFQSRLILGSGKYPLPRIREVIAAGEPDIVTLALRRVKAEGQENILDFLPEGKTILPNTSGARTAREALTLALLAREIGCGSFIKIEVITDAKYLLPDNEETLEAISLMAAEGFIPLPYMTPDLVMARKMEKAGAAAIMPLGAPIGSSKGLTTRELIRIMIGEVSVPVIVDAGLGRPSQACEALEMGAAAVMVNTAVALAADPPAMARAFKLAVRAGREAFLAGLGPTAEGRASSPLTDFLQFEEEAAS
ncbi:MAG: thiazole synthase [Deltaproteobacteria bacterium]|jgi:thiazole synthase|nr:thiazole synthase [Deltaproteobacteria bacterium]